MRSMGFHEGGEVETFGGPLAVNFIFNANKQIQSAESVTNTSSAYSECCFSVFLECRSCRSK